MAVDVFWYNEDNDILIVRYNGRWTWEEAHAANAISHHLLQDTHGRIDCIVDMSATRWFPPRTVENIQSLSVEPYRNLELAVLVGESFVHDVLQTYLDNFGTLPYRLVFATSFKRAVGKILCSRVASTSNSHF